MTQDITTSTRIYHKHTGGKYDSVINALEKYDIGEIITPEPPPSQAHEGGAMFLTVPTAVPLTGTPSVIDVFDAVQFQSDNLVADDATGRITLGAGAALEGLYMLTMSGSIASDRDLILSFAFGGTEIPATNMHLDSTGGLAMPFSFTALTTAAADDYVEVLGEVDVVGSVTFHSIYFCLMQLSVETFTP